MYTLSAAQMQEGLAQLLHFNGGRNKEYLAQRDRNECMLAAHPFGLDTMIAGHSLDVQTRLVAYPGHTDESVNAMMLMLQYHAAVRPINSRTDFRLRVIRIRKPERHWRKQGACTHDLYFELITGVGSFICGGVNDYSGEGGRGGEQLEAAFKFLGALYEKRVEEHVLSEEDAEAAVKKLYFDYNDFLEERRTE